MAGPKEAADAARSSLAVATLLRMADADLRDAAVLESGRDPRNAPALAGCAVARMIDAVAVTEVGWPLPLPGDLEPIPEHDPLKRSLVAASALFPTCGSPMPLDDGRAPRMPDRGTLREGMLAARALLKDLTTRFEVDLFGDAPAGRILPARPEPSPPPPSPPSPEVPRPTVPRRAVPPAAARTKAARPPTPAVSPSSRISVVPSARGLEHTPEPPPSIGPPAQTRAVGISSTAFWSLMDSWKVPDLQALDLIGHSGGLTKKGTRPRFKLAGEEVDMLHRLQEIDAALSPLGLDAPLWLNEPVEGAPFEGSTPLAFLVRTRIAGMRETIRFILQHGLRMSMAT